MIIQAENLSMYFPETMYVTEIHLYFCDCLEETRLSKKSFVGFHMATSSLAVGRFAAKKGSLCGQKRLAPLAKRSTCSKSRRRLANVLLHADILPTMKSDLVLECQTHNNRAKYHPCYHSLPETYLAIRIFHLHQHGTNSHGKS